MYLVYKCVFETMNTTSKQKSMFSCNCAYVLTATEMGPRPNQSNIQYSLSLSYCGLWPMHNKQFEFEFSLSLFLASSSVIIPVLCLRVCCCSQIVRPILAVKETDRE